ncbi:unnamed protein product [Ilex paraguariensis]|uniref:Uncharacterized protein n=1 Tax=Ilex paraguariensis TaxID=185542 RepID=A0ABC8T5U8_9AQUA
MGQVRTETEQWSQMQAMLGQVREEMEMEEVQEWRQKALTFETKANELQTEISAIKGELEKLRMVENKEATTTTDLPLVSLGKEREKEKHVLHCDLKENHHTNDKESKKKIANQKSRVEQTREILTTRNLPPISLGKQIEKEKRILILRFKTGMLFKHWMERERERE